MPTKSLHKRWQLYDWKIGQTLHKTKSVDIIRKDLISKNLNNNIADFADLRFLALDRKKS